MFFISTERQCKLGFLFELILTSSKVITESQMNTHGFILIVSYYYPNAGIYTCQLPTTKVNIAQLMSWRI